MLSKITVSPAPHISQKRSTRGVMLDVMIPAPGGVGDGDLCHFMCG
ncbi:MAG: hypothetical protein ACYSUS_03365 [Planctomycetota bacterium]|jgi:hypothetical protein